MVILGLRNNTRDLVLGDGALLYVVMRICAPSILEVEVQLTPSQWECLLTVAPPSSWDKRCPDKGYYLGMYVSRFYSDFRFFHIKHL